MDPNDALQKRIEFLKARAESLQQGSVSKEDPTSAASLAEQLAAAMIPKDMPVTPPDKYRDYIFQKELCPALKAFGFDRRHWVDRLFENVTKGTKAAKQFYVFGRVVGLLQNKGAIVVLPGNRGVGKTTICAQIAIQRLWQDWHSRFNGGEVTERTTSYRKLNEIVSKLKGLYADYGSIQIERMEHTRNFLCGAITSSTGSLMGGGADLLIIDELNEPSEDSKHKDRILTDIVDRRYSRCLDTVLITNQPADAFEATINSSVLSRSREHGAIIPCEWESFRDTSINDHPHI